MNESQSLVVFTLVGHKMKRVSSDLKLQLQQFSALLRWSSLRHSFFVLTVWVTLGVTQCRSFNLSTPHTFTLCIERTNLFYPSTIMCLDLRVSGQRGHEWVSLYTHYCGGDDRAVPISEGLLLCVSLFFALQYSSRPDQTRPALQGGWVCFQFSPLPCPGKHHFQNQTERVFFF